MKTALYRHFDSSGKLLYVGISLSALNRLGQHAEHAGWFGDIATVRIEHFPSREEALQAERMAIISERPVCNIVHRKAMIEAQIAAEKQAKQALADAAAAKADLTARVVYFKAAYSIQEAACMLSISGRVLRKMMAEGKVSLITFDDNAKKPSEFITGWQLIELIEWRVKESKAKTRAA